MEKIKLKDVKKYLKNTKKHPKKQIDKIKLSIKEFGYISPIIIDKDNNIIAGHGRAIALEELGYDEVEVIRVENLTAAQIKAYRIADNKLGESDWDDELLKEEFLELKGMDFDLSLTGFDIIDVDNYFKGVIIKEKEYDENIETNTTCPKCGYEW